MKVNGKYNFLLIHDDGATKSYRISRNAIRTLIAIVILLPIVSGVTLWFAWQTWQQKQAWGHEERALRQELTNMRAQVDRLQHVERLIQLYDAGQLEQSAAPRAGGDTAPATETPDPPAESAVDTPAPVGTDTPPAVEPPQAEGGPDLAIVDTGQVRAGNVTARLKNRRLSISIDLHNEVGRQIAGTLFLFLLTADGQRMPLSHNDPTFRMTRLKKFAATAIIPDAVADLTNASLLVEVISNDKTLIFRQLYPISD